MIEYVQMQEDKFKNSLWKRNKNHYFLLSIHKLGTKLIHIQTTISNSAPRPNCHNSYNFLTIFYLPKEIQNAGLQVFQKT